MQLIVAIDRNWGIGYQGKLLARISADLKRFKALTTGHTVVLGHKTLETFPGGKPLPNRRNIIMSTDKSFVHPDAETCHSVAQAVALAPEDAFVIGGASVYTLLLPYCDKAYVTQIDAEYTADCYFPSLDANRCWAVEETGDWQEEDGVRFRYVTYIRRK
ncbi:MAG: dihydrofolate reductase [Pseudoflavonifractor sp.]